MSTFSQRERMEQFILKLKIRKILLATRVVLFLLLVVHGVESNPGPRKRGTRARDRVPNKLSDNRSEDMSKLLNGSDNTEINQQRNVTTVFQAVTVSPNLHKPKSMFMLPSETQFQLPTKSQYQPSCQVQSRTASKTQYQPSSQSQSEPISQPKHPSQALSQPHFQTQYQLPSPVELQPLNLLTPASPVRDNVDSSALQDILSQLKHNNDMFQRIIKDQEDTKSELKHLNDMLQRMEQNQGDTSVLLNRGIEELTQKVDRLESRLHNLNGENEQLETHLRNGNSMLHGTVKKEEKQDKVWISDDNFARSYNQHVYNLEKQGRTKQSNNCCYSKESMESITKERTDYYFDEIVFKDESNLTDYMIPFSVEDIKDSIKWFKNRPATSVHQNTSRKCWDTKETLADSMKPSALTKDDVIDYLYRDFLPQINQHVITLPARPIPPRDFNVRVTPVSGFQKNELSRILFCRRCGFIKHLVIEVLDTNTDVSNSRSYQKELSSRKVSNISSCVSPEDYSPILIRKDLILAQEQSTRAITRLTDNSSSLFRGQVSKKASNSGEILITMREQSLIKVDIISGMLVTRNNKSYPSSWSVKFRAGKIHTDRFRIFVRRLSNGTMVHNSRDELCALLLCPCCGTVLDDRIMWLLPMSENYKASFQQVSLHTSILCRRDAQRIRNFTDTSCRGTENISAAKRDMKNSGRKQLFDCEQDVIYNRNRKAYQKVSERRPAKRRNPRQVRMNAYLPFAPEHLDQEPDAPLEGSLKPRKDLPGQLNHYPAQKILPFDSTNQNNEHDSVIKSFDVNTVMNSASTREQLECKQVIKTAKFSDTNGELAIDQAVKNNDYSLVPEIINGVSSFEFNHPENKSANQTYDPLPIQKMVGTSEQGDRCSPSPNNLECERAVMLIDIVTRHEAPDIDLTVQGDNTLSLQVKYDCSNAIQMNAPSFLSESQNNQATLVMGELSSQKEPDRVLNFQAENRSPIQEHGGEEPSFPRMHSQYKPFIQRMNDRSSLAMITNEFAILMPNSPRTMDNLTKEPDTKSDNLSSPAERLEKDISVFMDGPTPVAAETLKRRSTFQRKDMSLVPGHSCSDLAIQNNEVLSLAEQLKSKAVVYKRDRPDVLSASLNRTSIHALQQSECKQAVKRLEFSPTPKMSSSLPAKWKHCPTTEPISGVGDYTSPPQIPPDSTVQALLEHGYNQHTVRDAYDKIHQSCRSGAPLAADMMEAILDMEQNEKDIGAHIPKLESDNGPEAGTLPAKRGHDRACVNSSKAQKGPDILPDSQGCKLCCSTLTMIVFLMCGHMMMACPHCAKDLRKCPECKKTIKRIIEPIF